MLEKILLPAICIEVEEGEAMDAIKYFRMSEAYYLEASILEAIEIIKVVPGNKIDKIEEGLTLY